jgi:hypothetical protein
MASARIPFNRSSELGQKLNEMVKQGVAYRKAAEELYRILAKYSDAPGDIATDLSGNGITVSSGQASTIRDLTQRSAAETADVVLTGQGITQGNETNTKVLLDTLG